MAMLLFMISAKNLEQWEMTTEDNEQEQRWWHQRNTRRPMNEVKWGERHCPIGQVNIWNYLQANLFLTLYKLIINSSFLLFIAAINTSITPDYIFVKI